MSTELCGKLTSATGVSVNFSALADVRCNGFVCKRSLARRFKITASGVCPHTVVASGSPASARGRARFSFCRAKSGKPSAPEH